MIASTGPADVLSYLLAGAIVLSVLRMLGELAVARPALGSFAAYARERDRAGWAGFTIGWLYWYQWAIVLAIEATAGASLLHRWVDLADPGVGGRAPLPADGDQPPLGALVRRVRVLVRVDQGRRAIVAGSSKSRSAELIGAGDSPTSHHLTDDSGFAPEGVAAILAGVVVVFFAFYGGEVVTIAAAESDDPGKADRARR